MGFLLMNFVTEPNGLKKDISTHLKKPATRAGYIESLN